MFNIQFFERFTGAFMLWLVALLVSLVAFNNSMPVYMDLELSSFGLFLTFFLIWGLVYTIFYVFVAVYFFVLQKESDVPLPPRQATKRKKPRRKK